MEWVTAKALWEIGIHLLPIVLAIILATIKIAGLLKKEMESHVNKTIFAVVEVEKRLVASIEAIWRDQDKQDSKISEAEKALYRMEGRFQAIGFRVVPRASGDEQDP